MLTAHFSVEEWRCADGTPYPPSWVATRLTPLCVQLELLRFELGDRPMTILSGYRTPSYNRAIGGARASQHLEGRAADIRVYGVPAARVHAAALRLYGQGLLTIGGLGAYPRFTHIDIRDGARLARWSGSRTLV